MESTLVETPKQMWREVYLLVRLAVPISLQTVARFGVQTVSVLFLSKIGVQAVSSAVLSQSVYNITGLSIIIGMSSGMDTLCGQAFGAGSYPLVGVTAQRATLILLCMCVPIFALWSQVHWIFDLFGEAPEVSALASSYLRATAISLPLSAVGTAVYTFLACQNIVGPALVVNVLELCLCPFVFMASVRWTRGDFIGVALANDFINALDLALMLAIAVLLHFSRSKNSPLRSVWPGFSSAAWRGWPEYLSLGLPGCALMCLEWWLFEFAVILSSRLPDSAVALAITGVSAQLVALPYMVPLGIQEALSIRVSNMLGAGHAESARRAVNIALTFTVCISVTVAAAFALSRRHLALIFFPDGVEDAAIVRRPLQDCILWIASGMLPDWCSCTLVGALQGTGKQYIGARIYVFTHWVLGLFMLWLLPFRCGWGVRGVWAALASIAFVQVAALAVAVYRIDWRREEELAMERVNGGEAFLNVYGSDDSCDDAEAGGAPDNREPLLPECSSIDSPDSRIPLSADDVEPSLP